ncbi:protein kinase [Mucor ambiguus]|uniref:non-specific serine/threonine protein kinase n=1 Tax=Mucor ambiguus TaxID=91626 RepID=A0A0C9N253_9FUNG|nr:protein kinase [Mucor ambiguus]
MPSQKVTLLEAQRLLNTTIDNYSIKLISILGIGAYGVVYLGAHVSSGHYVAVKLLTHMNISYKESDIHAYLSGHPNILKFEKVVQENHKTFMVIEYTAEGDLFAAITKNKYNIVGNNDAIRHIFLQIIDAVHFCHQNNIAHRDLKPENIMLGPQLQVKLADFGLATLNSVSNEFGCGSTFYFSPECQGATAAQPTYTNPEQPLKGYSTQKNDIWSLGVILINLTAGRNPWKQATVKNSTFAAYVRNPRHFFRTILPCISEELERILLRIFCLNPARRISLPELRLYIQKCQSFVQPQTIVQHMNKKKSLLVSAKRHNHHLHLHHHIYQPKTKKRAVVNAMSYSDSITETMLHYVKGFTDEDYYY